MSKVIKESSVANNGEGWLIIDDLVDTGETIKVIRSSLPINACSHLLLVPGLWEFYRNIC